MTMDWKLCCCIKQFSFSEMPRDFLVTKRSLIFISQCSSWVLRTLGPPKNSHDCVRFVRACYTSSPASSIYKIVPQSEKRLSHVCPLQKGSEDQSCRSPSLASSVIGSTCCADPLPCSRPWDSFQHPIWISFFSWSFIFGLNHECEIELFLYPCSRAFIWFWETPQAVTPNQCIAYMAWTFPFNSDLPV